MNECKQCGQPQQDSNSRCHYCGSLNSKIDNILAIEAAEVEKRSFKGRLKIILQASNKKEALLDQFKSAYSTITAKGWFTLFIIFIFIFAMTFTVI